MAYFVDYATTYLNAASTAVSINMPPHQVDDILVAWVTMDTGTASITTGTGWSTPASNTTQASITATWFWKKATSNNEILNITTTDGWACGVYCIRDVDPTTSIDVSLLGSAAAPTNPAKAASQSVTTTVADTFILYLVGTDLVATAAHSEPGVHHITSFDNQGTTATTSAAQSAAWYIQRSAGATPAPSWMQSAMAAYTRLTIAFRNKSGGIIPAYIDDVVTPATTISNCTHYSTLNNISFPAALTTTGSMTNGKTTAYVTGAVAADLGIVPFSAGISKAAATQAQTALTGYEMALTGGRNWSTGLIMGSFIGGTPKMGTFGIGSVSEGGCVIRIGSSASNWTAYQVAAKDAVPTLENRSVWAIKPGHTASAYGAGSAVTVSAVTYLQSLTNQPSFASQAILSEVYQVFTQVVAGGSSSAPVDSDGLASIGKSFRLPVIQKAGGAGIISYVPIQIGGGDAVNFQIDAGALQFPRAYNIFTKEISFHAPDNAVGISYAGKSGDTIKHTNSVITSPSIFYWEINSAATSAATWDFTGLTVVNATVTLRNIMTFSSMSFSNCAQVDASGCTLTSCNIQIKSSSSNKFIVSGTSLISNSVINTTSLPAGISSSRVADPSVFTDNSFIGSTSTGHAIELTTPGTYSLSGNVFTGYGASGSTSAAIYNNSGGLVTLNIAGGGSVPTIRNGTGASTTVNAAANLTLTGLVAGTEVRAYIGTNPATNTEIAGVESSGTSFNFSHSVAGQQGIIHIFNVAYLPIYQPITYSGSDQTIPIQQTLDRNYQP